MVDEAVSLARRWIEATGRRGPRRELAAGRQLAALVRDPEGLDLAVRFVDRVARPEDVRVAARELSTVRSRAAAGFLRPADRLLLGVGARLARLVPHVVVPLARRRLRQMVGHLVVDARDPALAAHLARARSEGLRLNVNLLGEAVLGEDEAARRARRTLELLERADVDYVSVKVSSLVSQISTWDTDGTVRRVAERLRPLYRAAVSSSPPAFVNLDMEEYRDLDLTIAAFTSLLAEPELRGLEAGIVLQAYLPDSVGALEHVAAFAAERVAGGGAGIKVRVVKGANLSMEHVEAELHGWAPAPYGTKAEVDANYLRLVEMALRPERAGSLRLGVASHNLYDVALAHLLARRRGLAAMLDVEMLQGMAPAQARAVRDEVGTVVLYTPVVAPADLEVAVSYLVRRLEENAQPQNFLHALSIGSDEARRDQEERFRAAAAALASTPVARRRSAARPPAPPTFANTTDSDPALPEVRAWAATRVAARPAPANSPVLATTGQVDAVVARGRDAQPGWAALPAAARAAVLRRAADEIEARRGDLVTAMAAEGGKSVAEADPEVSEAVDHARYDADRALELDPAAGHLATDGARFHPPVLTLVAPPWNFPVAIPTSGVVAALAAGSAVVVKPAGAVPRCTEVVVEALHAALATVGVAPDVVQVVRTDEGERGRALVAHPGVDVVVLTGSIETARLFSSWRAGREGGPGLLAETSGKNAVVVTPSADVDLAVADVVRSAFGHAGQKCSAASLVILVGSAATSERLRRQLVDAVRSLRVGWPADLGATMGPLIEPPQGKLARALTRLDPGETWLVEPRPLDDTGRLWSPGLKDGVAPGSYFHRTECFGPVLGIMRAATLDEAVEQQNGTPFGLTGGLHALDEGEIARWLDTVEVGNAYVNRHTTGAIVRRQPFGGWKDSVVGPGPKAGGPNYVAQLGTWSEAGLPTRIAPLAGPVRAALDDLFGLVTSSGERAWLWAAAGSDAAALADELGREDDASGLSVEQDVLRYRPVPLLTVRAGAGTRLVELSRVMLAALAVGAPVRLSLDPAVAAALAAEPADLDPAGPGPAPGSAGPGPAPGLAGPEPAPGSVGPEPAAPGPDARGRAVTGPGLPGPRSAAATRARRRLAAVTEVTEATGSFARRVHAGEVTGRVRVLRRDRASLPGALADGGATVLAGPVLAAGRRELLTVLREQAISRTLHRFGHLPPHR
ncbi:MAG TPA: proline dehydrogenase family protein [Acidimicrobiales bacterium]|nr:proline dehydrogenase family protein [Acidimicrobiales bacterium]